jgi:hypothetical protein
MPTTRTITPLTMAASGSITARVTHPARPTMGMTRDQRSRAVVRVRPRVRLAELVMA